MVMVNIHGRTQTITLASFTRVWSMVQDFLNNILQGMNMKVNINIIRDTVMDSIDGRMETYIMGSLSTNWDKVRVKWFGIRVRCMRDNGEMGYKMGLENFIWRKDISLNSLESLSLSMALKWKQQKMSLSYHQYWVKNPTYHKPTTKLYEHRIFQVLVYVLYPTKHKLKS